MSFKEIIQNLGNRNKEDKEKFREILKERRMLQKVEEMEKSANQRELERFYKEKNEEKIKNELNIARKIRFKEINSNNPLNIPNIIKNKGWEVMKEPSLFNKKGTILTNKENVLRGNKHLFDNGGILCH